MDNLPGQNEPSKSTFFKNKAAGQPKITKNRPDNGSLLMTKQENREWDGERGTMESKKVIKLEAESQDDNS